MPQRGGRYANLGRFQPLIVKQNRGMHPKLLVRRFLQEAELRA